MRFGDLERTPGSSPEEAGLKGGWPTLRPSWPGPQMPSSFPAKVHTGVTRPQHLGISGWASLDCGTVLCLHASGRPRAPRCDSQKCPQTLSRSPRDEVIHPQERCSTAPETRESVASLWTSQPCLEPAAARGPQFQWLRRAGGRAAHSTAGLSGAPCGQVGLFPLGALGCSSCLRQPTPRPRVGIRSRGREGRDALVGRQEVRLHLCSLPTAKQPHLLGQPRARQAGRCGMQPGGHAQADGQSRTRVSTRHRCLEGTSACGPS